MSSAGWLWGGVAAIGVFHGLNPAMGWPLAVAAGLTERRGRAVVVAAGLLAAGHLLAMALVLLPFALLAWLSRWGAEVRVAAGALVLLFGVYRWFRRRHPRWLVRVRPSQLLLWSFLMATAHGAALMLLPLLLGLCRAPEPGGAASGHAALAVLLGGSAATALAVTLLHGAAMASAGLAAAWLVYRHLGLRVLRSAWLNLDGAWALALAASGGAALALALADVH